MAEEACGFEHRDLHWGNLLVRRDSSKATACKLRYVSLAAPYTCSVLVIELNIGVGVVGTNYITLPVVCLKGRLLCL